MAVISVPKASKKIPETASMMLVTMDATQFTMLSKIQLRSILLTSPALDAITWVSSVVHTALNQGLQVCHGETQRVEHQPGYNDTL